MLWNLVFHKILMEMKSGDLVILIMGKHPPTSSNLMESALAKVHEWGKYIMGVNTNKTELVLFTRKYEVPSFTITKTNGTALKLSKKTKYLGIILDSKQP